MATEPADRPKGVWLVSPVHPETQIGVGESVSRLPTHLALCALLLTTVVWSRAAVWDKQLQAVVVIAR